MIYRVGIEVVDKNGELVVESMTTKILGNENNVEVMVFTNIYNKHKEEQPKTPNTGGRFSTAAQAGGSNGGATEAANNVLATVIALFGILITLAKSKDLRGLIGTKRRDIIARDE